MKKRLIDLTQQEYEQICNENSRCSICQLAYYHDGSYVCLYKLFLHFANRVITMYEK